MWWPPTSSICYNKSSQSLFSYDSSVKEREQKLLGMTTFIITDLKVNTDPETQQLDDTAWMNPGGQTVQYWEGGGGWVRYIRPGLKLAPNKLCTCVRGWDVVNVPKRNVWFQKQAASILLDLLAQRCSRRKERIQRRTSEVTGGWRFKWSYGSARADLSLLIHPAARSTSSKILI